MHAFQAINDTVRTPWFGVALFGAALFGAIAAVVNIVRSGPLTVTAFAASGAVIYVCGVLIVTFAGNVPLNDDLALVIHELEFATARQDLEARWNQLNLLRAVASSSAFACLLGALAIGWRSRTTIAAPSSAARAYGEHPRPIPAHRTRERRRDLRLAGSVVHRTQQRRQRGS